MFNVHVNTCFYQTKVLDYGNKSNIDFFVCLTLLYTLTIAKKLKLMSSSSNKEIVLVKILTLFKALFMGISNFVKSHKSCLQMC